MERLWTPWRMTYVSGEKRGGCVFCDALATGDDPSRLVLLRGDQAYIILNLYPYNSGHAMVVPYAHAATLGELPSETRAELMELVALLIEASERVFRCDGFNAGLNIGEVAGAGVAEHLHVHVVPRWKGDANFMPILAGTTVMPEMLPVTYARLRAELEALTAARARRATPQAGGVVVLPDRRAVVLRRGRTGDIAFPKGHVEPGESLAQTALREVREETGVEAAIVGWLGSTEFRYPDTAAEPLHYAAYFVMTAVAMPELDDHLRTDALLAPLDEAAGVVTVDTLRELLAGSSERLRAVAEPTT